jgi:dCTP deaminase
VTDRRIYGAGLLESADIFDRVVNRRDLSITPWEMERLQPASYEMALGSKFLIFDPLVEVIDPLDLKDYTHWINIDDDEQSWYDAGYYLLRPGEFILGSSIETFSFPNDLAGELTGKSSIGRLGLQVHATAGFFDPGFDGTATLEISNISPVPIKLWPGLLVAQMRFVSMSRPSEWAYGHPSRNSHYQGQAGPTPSRITPRPQIRPLPVDGEQLQLPGVDWSQYEHSGQRGEPRH